MSGADGGMKKRLRDYQENALRQVGEHWKAGTKRVLVCSPAGSGKTLLASEAVRRIVAVRRKRVLWMAHRGELVDQAVKALRENTGMPVGIIQADRKNPAPNADIQVATVQTLRNRDVKVDFDMIVGDECHHYAAEDWYTQIERWPEARMLMLSATPVRGDGKPLRGIADVLVSTIQPRELIEQGFLVPCEILCPPSVAKRTLSEDPAEAYIKWGGMRRAVSFCQSIEGARYEAHKLRERGIAAESIDQGTPWATRKMIFGRVARGETKVMTNVFVATEGLDIPEIEVCILARTVGNAAMFVQCLDSDTEILTKRGFVGIDDMKEDDVVAAMDTKDSSVHWKPVMAITRRPMGQGEEMYSLSNPHLDIRVTGGHRMLFQRRIKRFNKPNAWTDGWSIDTAENMVSKYKQLRIPVSAVQDVPDAPMSDDEIRFIGWFLTDGTYNSRRTQIFIVQADHQPQIHDLRSCIQMCGFTCAEYKRDPKESNCFANGHMQTVFSVPSGRMRFRKGKEIRGWDHISKFLDKTFPQCFETMSARQFTILLEAMNAGNGAKRRKVPWKPSTYSISTGHRVMAERLQALAIVRGFRCSLARDGEKSWQVHISPDRVWSLSVVAHDSRPVFKKSPHTPGERVWCVKNELGTLFVRRNGKTAIVGNCVGRAMRPAPWSGKTKALLIDLVGATRRFGTPEADRHYDLDGDPLKVDKDGMNEITCSKCKGLKPRGGGACPMCGHQPDREPPLAMLPVEAQPMEWIDSVAEDDRMGEYIDMLNEVVISSKPFSDATRKFREKTGKWPEVKWMQMWKKWLDTGSSKGLDGWPARLDDPAKVLPPHLLKKK